MAYFCLDCWNEINNTNDTADKYEFSKYLGLCEGCEELKQVIVREKRSPLQKTLDRVFSTWWLRRGVCLLVKLIILPYYIVMHYNRKKK